MCLILINRICCGGRFFDFFCIVKHHANIPYSSHTGFTADGGLAVFNFRITKGAFFWTFGFPVEIDFLVRTCTHTLPPAPASILIDEHNAVFLAFVDGTRRTSCHTWRVKAMFAQAWQIHHEGILELAENFFVNIIKVFFLASFFKCTSQVVFPVWTLFNFFHYGS